MTQRHEQFEHQAEGAAFIAAGVGAAAGVSIATAVEGMGLALGGTAIALGAAPFVALGALAGLAAYGLTKVLSSSDDNIEIIPLPFTCADEGVSSVEVSDEFISSLGTFFLHANADLPGLNPDGYDLCGEDTSEVDHS